MNRAVVTYAALTFALLTVLGAVFIVGAGARTMAAFDSGVQARVREVAAGLRVADGAVMADGACDLRVALDEIAVYKQDGTLICAAPRPSFGQNQQVRAANTTPQTLNLDGRDLRVVAQPVRNGDGTVVGTVVAGRATDDIATSVDLLRSTLLFGIPLGIVMCIIFGYIIARLAARDPARLATALNTLAEGDLSQRLSPRGSKDERALRQTINTLLDRLAESQAQQRRFVADASHELRTPLSVIEAEATLALRRERSASEYRQTLGVVVNETEHIRRLIDDLLTLARADAGLADVVSQPVDLSDVVIEAVERVGAMAEQKGVALAPRLPAETDLPPMVAGDAVLLERLLGNLLKNAIAYTPVGGRIEAGARREGNACRLWVSDSGMGIAPEHLPRIFDRFYRADPTSKRGESGGLGLAICQWVALAHGGRIDVASTLDEGSIFIVSLPILATQQVRVIRSPLNAPDPISFTGAMTAPIISITAPSALTVPVTLPDSKNE